MPRSLAAGASQVRPLASRRSRLLGRVVGGALVCVLAVSASADQERFVGWSSDGAYYAVEADGRAGAFFEVCLVEHGGAELPLLGGVQAALPEELLVNRCMMLSSLTALRDACRAAPGADCDEGLERWARGLFSRPAPLREGPLGQTLALRFEADGRAHLEVRVGGQRLADQGLLPPSATDETESAKGERQRPRLVEAFWRPDGGAVAVQLEQRRVQGTRELQPLSWVVALPVRARVGASAGKGRRATVPGARVAAERINLVGLRLYKAQRYEEAAVQFRAALAAAPDYAMAHYNLACVAAILGDKAAVVGQLRWLKAAETDPVARAKLDKARSDPDLTPMLLEPEVRALLGL